MASSSLSPPLATSGALSGPTSLEGFDYMGGRYFGLNPVNFAHVMSGPQTDEKSCWAAVLSNCQALLDVGPSGEGGIIKIANKALGKGTGEDYTYMIRDGASFNNYGEIINIMKESTKIWGHRKKWTKENAPDIWEHIARQQKPVIIGSREQPHVIVLMAIGLSATSKSSVIYYDSADGDFHEVKTLSLHAIKISDAYLMSKYS